MAIPFATSLTPQTARQTPSRRVAAKLGGCCVALLGFVGQATTFVARLAIIPILPATRSTEDWFSGSLTIIGKPHQVRWSNAAHPVPR